MAAFNADFTTRALKPPLAAAFVRSSLATSIDLAGAYSVVAANSPAFDGDDGVILEAASTQLLANPGFSGAVSGSPGTIQAGWASSFSTGTRTVTAIDLGNSQRYDCTAQRMVDQFSFSAAANTTYTFSAYLHGSSENLPVIHSFYVVSLPAGAAFSYRFNGAVVADTTVLTGSGIVEIIIVTAGTAGTSHVRLGFGLQTNATGWAQWSKPQLEALAFRSSYIFNTTGTITATDQMLYNTGFAGAVPGAPGTTPTGWSLSFSTGTLAAVTAIDQGNSLSFSATAQRLIYFQTMTLAALSVYTWSVSIDAVSGVICSDLLTVANAPAGSTTSYRNNGNVISSGSIPAVGILECILTTSVTSGTGLARLGVGTSNNATGSATMSKPMFQLASARGTYIYSFVTGVSATLVRSSSYIGPTLLTDMGIASQTNEYTIAVLFKVPFDSSLTANASVQFDIIFDVSADTNNRLTVYWTSNGRVTAESRISGVAVAATTGNLTFAKDSILLLAVSKGATDGLLIKLGSSTFGTNTAAGAKNPFASAVTSLGLNINALGAITANSTLQAVQVRDSAMTQAQLTALTPADLLNSVGRRKLGIGYGIGL